jgi:hypothetical protein
VGILWRQSAARQNVLSKRGPRLGLPYASAHAPLTDVISGLRYDSTEDGETFWQGVLVGLGLAAVLSILLGPSAIVLSLLAVIASAGIRLMVRRGKKPAFLMAIVTTGLPWALGAALGWAGDMRASFGFAGAGLALGSAFTFLTWSVTSVELVMEGASGRSGLARRYTQPQ